MPTVSPAFKVVPSMTLRLTVVSMVHTDALSRTSTASSSRGVTVAVLLSHPASSRSARLKRYDMFFFYSLHITCFSDTFRFLVYGYIYGISTRCPSAQSGGGIDFLGSENADAYIIVIAGVEQWVGFARICGRSGSCNGDVAYKQFLWGSFCIGYYDSDIHFKFRYVWLYHQIALYPWSCIGLAIECIVVAIECLDRNTGSVGFCISKNDIASGVIGYALISKGSVLVKVTSPVKILRVATVPWLLIVMSFTFMFNTDCWSSVDWSTAGIMEKRSCASLCSKLMLGIHG